MTKNEIAFLIGLEKLSRETGIIINGDTGVYLEEMDMSGEPDSAGYGIINGRYDDLIAWCSPNDEHYWEDYKHTIVKPNKEQS